MGRVARGCTHCNNRHCREVPIPYLLDWVHMRGVKMTSYHFPMPPLGTLEREPGLKNGRWGGEGEADKFISMILMIVGCD